MQLWAAYVRGTLEHTLNLWKTGPTAPAEHRDMIKETPLPFQLIFFTAVL